MFQLREKDDANLKLMSERIKSNQIQRLAREERDMLIQQVNTLSTQVSYNIGRIIGFDLDILEHNYTLKCTQEAN